MILSPEQLSSESYQIISNLYKIFNRWYGGPDTHKLSQLLELKGFSLSTSIPPLIYSRTRDLSLFHSFIGIFLPYQLKDFDFIFGFSRRSMNRLSGVKSPISQKFSINSKSPDLAIMDHVVKSLEMDIQEFVSGLPISKRPHRVIVPYERVLLQPDPYMSSDEP